MGSHTTILQGYWKAIVDIPTALALNSAASSHLSCDESDSDSEGYSSEDDDTDNNDRIASVFCF